MPFPRIGAAVRHLREQRGLTQRAAAEQAGLPDHVVLHKIEVGEVYLGAVVPIAGTRMERAKLHTILGDEILELMLAETRLRDGLHSLRVEAEKAACKIAADATPPALVVWGKVGSLEEAAADLAEATPLAAIDWQSLLTPATLSKALELNFGGPEVEACLQEVCDHWIDLMDMGEGKA